MINKKEIIDNMTLELRRGTLILSVLSQLKTPQYGYSLIQSLESRKIFIEAGTLYPLMRRLELQELLVSEWETTGTKPRKYYVLSESGKRILDELTTEWNIMASNMNELLNKGDE